MSIINGVAPMNVDHIRHEEPSTPSKDPLSSPAVHIQWQNSQSACAAMEELRAASSVPRRPPKPLTFDFELPASAAGPSSSTTATTSPSDPFLPSRARSALTVRPRALGHVQSHSQNDVSATPSADASKFLDMLGRASARVDENSRKRMRVTRTVHTLRSPLKGKERVRAAVGTRSLDELHDHTNLVNASSEHRVGTSSAHYSSLPIMPPKISPSQTVCDTTLTDTDADSAPITNVEPDAGAHAVDINTGSSTRARSVTQHAPPCSLTTENSQGRAEPSTPMPIRPVPIALRPPPPLQPALPKPVLAVATSTKPTPLAPPALAPLASACPQPDTPTATRPPAKYAATKAAARKGANGPATPITPESLPRRGASVSATANASTTTASQSLLSSSQGPRRALGMTRTASASSSSVRYSATVKRPFRPPRVQAPTSQPQQQSPKKDVKSLEGSDPDSSFDLAFDFDPEELEAAMRPFD
ncbi:hypothetical protein EI94DRAFT_1701541 [Lactarius quietus]|nr:hypothetical protein EI94DRAFT_1701541 [Lactarius quietus]